MTTKGYCLSLNDNQKNVVGNSNNIQDVQYNNLNLNQNQTLQQFNGNNGCSKSFAAITNHNKIDGQNYELNDTTKAHKQQQSFDISEKSSSNFNSNFDQNGGGDNSEIKKSSQASQKNSNSSTLSLHIAAYENAIEGVEGSGAALSDSEMNENVVEKKGGAKSIKNLKATSSGGPSSSDIQNSFEFPRQQEETENVESIKPEVMQFKASQRLLNPYETVGTAAQAESEVNAQVSSAAAEDEKEADAQVTSSAQAESEANVQSSSFSQDVKSSEESNLQSAPMNGEPGGELQSSKLDSRNFKALLVYEFIEIRKANFVIEELEKLLDEMPDDFILETLGFLKMLQAFNASYGRDSSDINARLVEVGRKLFFDRVPNHGEALVSYFNACSNLDDGPLRVINFPIDEIIEELDYYYGDKENMSFEESLLPAKMFAWAILGYTDQCLIKICHLLVLDNRKLNFLQAIAEHLQPFFDYKAKYVNENGPLLLIAMRDVIKHYYPLEINNIARLMMKMTIPKSSNCSPLVRADDLFDEILQNLRKDERIDFWAHLLSEFIRFVKSKDIQMEFNSDKDDSRNPVMLSVLLIKILNGIKSKFHDFNRNEVFKNLGEIFKESGYVFTSTNTVGFDSVEEIDWASKFAILDFLQVPKTVYRREIPKAIYNALLSTDERKNYTLLDDSRAVLQGYCVSIFELAFSAEQIPDELLEAAATYARENDAKDKKDFMAASLYRAYLNISSVRTIKLTKLVFDVIDKLFKVLNCHIDLESDIVTYDIFQAVWGLQNSLMIGRAAIGGICLLQIQLKRVKVPFKKLNSAILALLFEFVRHSYNIYYPFHKKLVEVLEKRASRLTQIQEKIINSTYNLYKRIFDAVTHRLDVLSPELEDAIKDLADFKDAFNAYMKLVYPPTPPQKAFNAAAAANRTNQNVGSSGNRALEYGVGGLVTEASASEAPVTGAPAGNVQRSSGAIEPKHDSSEAKQAEPSVKPKLSEFRQQAQTFQARSTEIRQQILSSQAKLSEVRPVQPASSKISEQVKPANVDGSPKVQAPQSNLALASEFPVIKLQPRRQFVHPAPQVQPPTRTNQDEPSKALPQPLQQQHNQPTPSPPQNVPSPRIERPLAVSQPPARQFIRPAPNGQPSASILQNDTARVVPQPVQQQYYRPTVERLRPRDEILEEFFGRSINAPRTAYWEKRKYRPVFDNPCVGGFSKPAEEEDDDEVFIDPPEEAVVQNSSPAKTGLSAGEEGQDAVQERIVESYQPEVEGNHNNHEVEHAPTEARQQTHEVDHSAAEGDERPLCAQPITVVNQFAQHTHEVEHPTAEAEERPLPAQPLIVVNPFARSTDFDPSHETQANNNPSNSPPPANPQRRRFIGSDSIAASKNREIIKIGESQQQQQNGDSNVVAEQIQKIPSQSFGPPIRPVAEEVQTVAPPPRSPFTLIAAHPGYPTQSFGPPRARFTAPIHAERPQPPSPSSQFPSSEIQRPLRPAFPDTSRRGPLQHLGKFTTMGKPFF